MMGNQKFAFEVKNSEKKCQIRDVIVHIDNDMDFKFLSDRVNRFHVDVIEHKLSSFNLTTAQKITVVDRIIQNMKLQEIN